MYDVLISETDNGDGTMTVVIEPDGPEPMIAYKPTGTCELTVELDGFPEGAVIEVGYDENYDPILAGHGDTVTLDFGHQTLGYWNKNIGAYSEEYEEGGNTFRSIGLFSDGSKTALPAYSYTSKRSRFEIGVDIYDESLTMLVSADGAPAAITALPSVLMSTDVDRDVTAVIAGLSVDSPVALMRGVYCFTGEYTNSTDSGWSNPIEFTVDGVDVPMEYNQDGYQYEIVLNPTEPVEGVAKVSYEGLNEVTIVGDTTMWSYNPGDKIFTGTASALGSDFSRTSADSQDWEFLAGVGDDYKFLAVNPASALEVSFYDKEDLLDGYFSIYADSEGTTVAGSHEEPTATYVVKNTSANDRYLASFPAEDPAHPYRFLLKIAEYDSSNAEGERVYRLDDGTLFTGWETSGGVHIHNPWPEDDVAYLFLSVMGDGELAFIHSDDPAPDPDPEPEIVTAAPPTFDDEALTVTIPDSTGVVYSVNGEEVAAGVYTYPYGTAVTVTAAADDGYVLEGVTEWTHTFPVEPEPEIVTAAPPTFDDEALTVTIPAVDGVEYLVDGEAVAAGVYTYPYGTAVTVTAAADDGYVLEGVTEWTHTFPVEPDPDPEPEPVDDEEAWWSLMTATMTRRK